MSARDKFIVLALVALVAAATVGAVLGAAPPKSQVPAYGGTYTEALVGEPRVLNPLFAVTSVDRDVSALLFTGLTRFDQRGSVVPDLASSFRVEPDGKTWTFFIRPDARWHDGMPVTADDVVYTVGLTLELGYRGPYSGHFAGVTVARSDELTVRFTLPDVYAPFVEATTLPLLPAHILRGLTPSELVRNPFNVRPTGTGPFRLESRSEARIVLVRNDSFYRMTAERARPYLDRVILRLYPDTSSALVGLARNEVQGFGSIGAADAERARRLRNLGVYFIPSNEQTVLFFNLAPERKLFRERVVRQAIALAINRPRILQLATDGHGAVADEPVPQSSWAYARDVRRYAYAPAEARALLEGAGWVDHDGDGVRDKGDVALRFSLLTNPEPSRGAAADQIAQDLAAVGIQARVEVVPFAELVDRRARARSFDAMVLAVSSGMDPDPYAFWHSTQTKDPGFNFTSYSTLATDRAMEAARRTLDQAKRKELYAQVFTQLAEDVPAIYLYFADYVYAVDRVVRGVRIASITDPAQRFWNVEEWYVKTAAAD